MTIRFGLLQGEVASSQSATAWAAMTADIVSSVIAMIMAIVR
jgi:hypothetical protein